MSRICWRLVDAVTRLLEPGERDAVRGDFAETGETGAEALGDALGLVARRQAHLWADWRPWAVLAGFIAPLGMMLSIVSSQTAGQNATYVWLYANNWDWALFQDAGFWREFAESFTFLFVSCVTLVCWAWTAGFVLGSLSRRMAPAYGALFCVTLLFGGLVGAPRYLDFLFQFGPPPSSRNSGEPILALSFYRAIFPMMAQALLVAVPALWAMRRSAGVKNFPRMFRMAAWSSAAVALLVLLVREPGFVFFLKAFWLHRIWQTWPMRALQLIVYWPFGYLAAAAIFRRRHDRIAAS